MKSSMIKKSSAPMRRSLVPTLVALLGLSCATSVCAAALNGQVLGGGAPIANSTVMLWAASAGTPKQLAQARTDTDGRFAITVPDSRSAWGRSTSASTSRTGSG